eukprot:CAMPEP_0115007690 /NCGR_PEP_ID=MMETSP0216-20121206/21372_1 /TAXON_ID=223996 /ORGANISM="Protocruzia adherens, Strain Boccale" /LENGTH=191 /DNA_ID=CAMNT_0002374765 /DNA_START=222 /DNA_END=797 /DNA_ORIENTATION=+
MTIVDHLLLIFQLIVGISGIRAASNLRLEDARCYYYLSMFLTIFISPYYIWTGTNLEDDYDHYSGSRKDFEVSLWLTILAFVAFSVYLLWVAFSLYAKLEVGDAISCKLVRPTPLPLNGAAGVGYQGNQYGGYPQGQNYNGYAQGQVQMQGFNGQQQFNAAQNQGGYGVAQGYYHQGNQPQGYHQGGNMDA